MNRLFERFILVQLRRAERQREDRRLQIKGQASELFWASKTIRPDVVIDFFSDSRAERLILDTKWKIPNGDQPSDEDLKQMYAYNLHFGASHSLLVYPRADSVQSETNGAFAKSASLPLDHRHSCSTHFIDLFDTNQKLRSDIGAQLLDHIGQSFEESCAFR